MIPDLAIIVSAYAVARLLNEYILLGQPGPKAVPLRTIIGIAAAAIIVVALLDVLGKSGSLADL